MKNYVKPDVFVTEFSANEAVAACATTESVEWNNQTITCVVDGKTVIFYSGCTESASNGQLVKYDDGTGEKTYYIWYNGHAGTVPDDDEQKLIDAILDVVNLKGQPGYHAGIATPDIITVHNMS